MAKNKPYVIITSSDAKFGDFLINHWLKSLLNNIDLKLVDIVVLNYGLSEKQKKGLLLQKVKVIDCVRDGHPVNLRFRDMLIFLEKSRYKVVMSCDGGDIIFQDDIMNLFKLREKEIKAAVEKLFVPFNEYVLLSKSFKYDLRQKIFRTLKNKKVINAGMIVSPVDKFKEICLKINSYVKNKNGWGPDQVLINYLLYKWGFYELDERYNFIVSMTSTKFKIKNGVFLDKNNKPIPVVHNGGGGTDFGRPIGNFGYGPEYNRLKLIVYYWMKLFSSVSFILAYLLKSFFLLRRRLEKQTTNKS